MPTPQICQSQEDALQWAKNNFPFESWKCLTDRPWAVTYRLINGEQNAYLKIVAPSVCDVSKTTPLLAKYFPKNIPRAIAHDKDKGLLLLESHNGVDFDRHLSDEKKHKIITTYARIQAKSAALSDIIAGGSGRINSNLLEDLLIFLSPDDQLPNFDGAMVNVDYFLGEKMAARYRDRIEHRLPMLQKFFDCGEDLPPTINHCDLRPSNAAEQEDGTCILYDWEDSALGPAGLSLHGMLSGCSSTAMILGGKPELVKIAKRHTHSLLLDAYINELAAGNYADKNVLKTKLPALVCAGVLLYVISYCRFPKQAGSYKKVIAGNLRRRLSDLLDLCDYLAITDPDNITAYVKQLRSENSGWRQERILKWFTTYYPTCFDSYWELGHYYRNQGHRELASEAYDEALKLNPDNPKVHNRLGLTLLEEGHLDNAVPHLRAAVQLNSEYRAAKNNLRQATKLQQNLLDARLPGVVPTLTVSRNERENQKLAVEKRVHCVKLFKEHGVLILNGLLDPQFMQQCYDEFLHEYQGFLGEKHDSFALSLGNHRYQVTLDIGGIFGNPTLYGNQIILDLMKRILGIPFVLGCYTSSLSLPGAPDQRLHKDHKALFESEPDITYEPSYAVTVMVPMISLNEIRGTTRVKKGSHRLTSSASKDLKYQIPIVNRGSCFLMDYRLSHRGQANRSNDPRPILSMVYQRPWFRDFINFKKQPSLKISEAGYETIPDKLKPLLSWTQCPFPMMR